MKNVFTLSLVIIGGVIGFILATTILFSLKLDSPFVLIGVGVIFAIVGGYGLAKMASHIDTLEASLQKVLTVLCVIIAFILLLFLAITLVMLKNMVGFN